LIAATTGLPSPSIRLNTAWPARANARPDAASSACTSPMSAPATNALAPAPVRMTPATVSSAPSAAKAASSSATARRLSALSTAGRSTVTVATAPSRATRMVSYSAMATSSSISPGLGCRTYSIQRTSAGSNL